MALMENLQELYVQCSNCGATLQFEDGSFQDCPLCHTKPTQQQLQAAAYFQKVPQKGVVISHEFVKQGDRPPEFVFVHPMSGHIPNYSGLIVEQHQSVVFTASGQPQVLDVPNLYPLVGDERSEQELLKAVAAGECGRIFQNISTRITFFDMRAHRCTTQLDTKIPGSYWKVRAKVGYNMCIVDHSKLEEIDFDMKREPEEVRHYIHGQVERAISEQLVAMILSFDGLDLRPAQDSEQLTQYIEKRLCTDEVESQLKANVAAALREQGFGIADDRGLEIDNFTCIDCSQQELVHCSLTSNISGEDHDCTGSKYITKGDHTSWTCPVCGQRQTWCPICQAFRTTCERSRVCDVCHHVI